MRIPFRATLLLLAAVLLTSARPGCGDPGVSVYVNNHRLNCAVQQEGGDLRVDAAAAATAMRVPYVVDASTGHVTVNGRVLGSARTQKGRVMASLREVAQAAGATVRPQPDLGIVDVITFDPRQRARAVADRPGAPPRAAPNAAPSADPEGILQESDMREVHDACVYHLQVMLGMQLTSRYTVHYDSMQAIRKAMGSEIVAAYTAGRDGEGGVVFEVHIPVGQRRDETTHCMIHELTHVWEHGASMEMGTPRLTEGLAEWTSYDLLKKLGYDREMKRLRANLALDYSEGFAYVQRMVDRIGVPGMLDHFRHTGMR